VHIAGALALLAFLVAFTARAVLPTGQAAAHPELWQGALGLSATTVVLALILLAGNTFVKLLAPSLVGLAAVALALAGWFAAVQPAVAQHRLGALPGMHTATNWVLLGVVGAVLLVLVVAAVGGWRRGTFKFLGPFVALVVSLTVINVVMVGTVVRLAELLKPTGVGLQTPESTATGVTVPADIQYPQLTVYFGLGERTSYVTLALLAALVLFGVVALVRFMLVGRSASGRGKIRSGYTTRFPRPATPSGWMVSAADLNQTKAWPWRRRVLNRVVGCDWAARVARARLVARLPRWLDWMLTGMTVAMLAIFATWLTDVPLDVPSWLQTTGNWLVAAMPLAVILLIRQGWKSLDSRRHIGIIWDVITFWPRAYHPLAPPCYAERAVPELQRRLWLIHDSKPPEPAGPAEPPARRPGGRAVLVAHSQGSVIAVAALLQRCGRPEFDDNDTTDEVSLVTFGSPLHTLYAWGFPAYFNRDVLNQLVPSTSASKVRLAGWTNCHYETDYIGREVGIASVDQPLDDPRTCWYVFGQPEPAPGRHSGYWGDPKVWTHVDAYAMAPGKKPPPVIPSQPGSTPEPAPL
jgi:hypothetical protein